jgi:N-acyl-D-aspartate/D-glutamate deacylase
LQRPGHGDSHRQILRRLERAAAAGLRMRGQVAPRPVGLLMSLRGRVHPLAGSPTFQRIAASPAAGSNAGAGPASSAADAALIAALADGATRTQILTELRAADSIVDRFAHAFELGDPPCWDADVARSLRALTAARGVDAIEVAYDIIAAGGTIYAPVANFNDGNLDAVREMLTHELTVPGLGDGGAHCTMIGDFDFPTFLASYWTRDVAPEWRMPIEWAVRQQCADTADLVGLSDRGRLLPGMRADVNIIDFASLGASAPKIVNDLPGNAKRLVSSAAGYVATLVAGEVTFEHGVHTGALNGAVARSR